MRRPFGCAQSDRSVSLPRAPRAVAATGSEPSFDALAARGASVAPGMREVARVETTGDGVVEVVRAGERDTCVRVAFEASSPVVARLLDTEGNVLAASDVPEAEGVLGQRGPVCVRRGDAVSAAAGGAEAAVPNVRWVAWQAP